MAVDFNRSWKKACAAQNETEFVRSLAEILASKDGLGYILTLERDGAELCIEILDHALAKRNLLRTSEKQAFLGTLWKLSGMHAILPNSVVIRDEINPTTSGQLQISGGSADVSQGQYRGHTVAVKTMKVGVSDDFQKIREQFCKEVIIWKSLSHPNILKLVSVLDGFRDHQFATVSEWMKHGNIMEYIGANATNRLRLLHGAVQGLKYLHDANLIHGDVKGANILVTNDTPPTACLADFGFTTLVPDQEVLMSSSVALQGGTMTFMAPELLAPSNYGLKGSFPTREADVYAFGLVIYQVLTGERPFHGFKPQELVRDVPLGVRPEKPRNAKEIGISNSLWRLMQKCLDGKIEGRPQIREVVEGVGNVAASWHTEMPPNDAEEWEDSDEDESDELRHVEVFGSHHTDEPLEVEASDEDYEIVYGHLYQDVPPPLATFPSKKRKGFRYHLKKVLEHKFRY